MSDSLQPHGLQPTRLLCPWDFLGKNIGVVCHFLLQEIFLTQGLNLGFLHYRQMIYHLSHWGSHLGSKSGFITCFLVILVSLLNLTKINCPHFLKRN